MPKLVLDWTDIKNIQVGYQFKDRGGLDMVICRGRNAPGLKRPFIVLGPNREVHDPAHPVYLGYSSWRKETQAAYADHWVAVGIADMPQPTLKNAGEYSL